MAFFGNGAEACSVVQIFRRGRYRKFEADVAVISTSADSDWWWMIPRFSTPVAPLTDSVCQAAERHRRRYFRA